MIPNVPQMQEWTGDRVRQIAGQGDLYIRTTYPLNLDGLNDVKTLQVYNQHVFLLLYKHRHGRKPPHLILTTHPHQLRG